MNGKVIKEAYTFDDLLLVPAKSQVVPANVSMKTRLTQKITLNVPILSAAMDTVTEVNMAAMMAKLGGMGFLHKNMPQEMQARVSSPDRASRRSIPLRPTCSRQAPDIP